VRFLVDACCAPDGRQQRRHVSRRWTCCFPADTPVCRDRGDACCKFICASFICSRLAQARGRNWWDGTGLVVTRSANYEIPIVGHHVSLAGLGPSCSRRSLHQTLLWRSLLCVWIWPTLEHGRSCSPSPWAGSTRARAGFRHGKVRVDDDHCQRDFPQPNGSSPVASLTYRRPMRWNETGWSEPGSSEPNRESALHRTRKRAADSKRRSYYRRIRQNVIKNSTTRKRSEQRKRRIKADQSKTTTTRQKTENGTPVPSRTKSRRLRIGIDERRRATRRTISRFDLLSRDKTLRRVEARRHDSFDGKRAASRGAGNGDLSENSTT